MSSKHVFQTTMQQFALKTISIIIIQIIPGITPEASDIDAQSYANIHLSDPTGGESVNVFSVSFLFC